LQAIYRDGNLILDDRLDASLEGKKLTLILVEDSVQLIQAEILRRIEQRRTFSPAQQNLPDTLTLLQEDRARGLVR